MVKIDDSGTYAYWISEDGGRTFRQVAWLSGKNAREVIERQNDTGRRHDIDYKFIREA